jgi:PAS domain S-box-containing protein
MTTARRPNATDQMLRQSAEEKIRLQEGAALPDSLSPDETRQLIFDLKVHHVELEMQNEELRRTQHKLETSRARYFELYDVAPVGYLTIDGEGLILEANLTVAAMLRMPRKSLIKQPLTRFFPPEDQDIYYLQRKQLFATVAPQSWDMRIINSAGSTFWAQLNAIPALNGECRITLEDITRRKVVENIIAANLRLSEYAVKHSLDELLTRIVDEAEHITDSTIGFFHFLDPDQVTLSLQAWSSNTLKTMCTAEGKGQHYSVDKAGVWVECIHTRRPAIHNDYATLQNRKGMPNGHAPVIRELVVPVLRNDCIVGIIGVGNKPSNYLEQDIEAVSRLINFTWDIVTTKQADEELKKNEHQYRTILHTLLDGFWVVDRSGRFIDVNEAYCSIIGYSRDELLEMYIQDVEALEDKADIDQRMQEIIQNGSHRFESQHRCKDGHIVDLEICVSHLSADDRLCASLRDITEIKRTTESLRSAATYTRSLIEASLDPLVTISPDGTITDVNEASVRVTGIAREQMIGTDFCTYFTDPEKAREGYSTVFSEGDVRDYPLAIRHVSGTITDVLYNATIFRNEQGEVQGVFAAARDVTGLKNALKLLQKAHDEMEARVVERTAELALANEQMKKVSFELIWAEEKERERIAGELHDQVGQSLLLAKMKLDALEDSLSDESLRSAAADAAALVATSILDIRSLTFRMRPPLLDTAGIDTVLEWLCTSISNDYKLQVNFDSDYQPKPLPADARYSLYQSVRELLINVAKHARTARAHLSLTSANGTLAVQVADDGAGFNPPEALLKHVNNGGFGLYNVRQRIEQLGGRIAIESAPGRGTKVTVTVPLSESGS